MEDVIESTRDEISGSTVHELRSLPQGDAAAEDIIRRLENILAKYEEIPEPRFIEGYQPDIAESVRHLHAQEVGLEAKGGMLEELLKEVAEKRSVLTELCGNNADSEAFFSHQEQVRERQLRNIQQVKESRLSTSYKDFSRTKVCEKALVQLVASNAANIRKNKLHIANHAVGLSLDKLRQRRIRSRLKAHLNRALQAAPDDYQEIEQGKDYEAILKWFLGKFVDPTKRPKEWRLTVLRDAAKLQGIATDW